MLVLLNSKDLSDAELMSIEDGDHDEHQDQLHLERKDQNGRQDEDSPQLQDRDHVQDQLQSATSDNASVSLILTKNSSRREMFGVDSVLLCF